MEQPRKQKTAQTEVEKPAAVGKTEPAAPPQPKPANGKGGGKAAAKALAKAKDAKARRRQPGMTIVKKDRLETLAVQKPNSARKVSEKKQRVAPKAARDVPRTLKSVV